MFRNSMLCNLKYVFYTTKILPMANAIANADTNNIFKYGFHITKTLPTAIAPDVSLKLLNEKKKTKRNNHIFECPLSIITIFCIVI